jgi:hypothetical protein
MNPQRNDSLHDQMMDVIGRAEEMGCYDAADWIKARWNIPPYREARKALCTCEIAPNSVCAVHASETLLGWRGRSAR